MRDVMLHITTLNCILFTQLTTTMWDGRPPLQLTVIIVAHRVIHPKRSLARWLQRSENSCCLGIEAGRMLQVRSTSALAKLRCSVQRGGECRLWVAPALQVFSVDFCGRFCQYCRLSGLFVRWCSAGPDEFRERGSIRLNDLKGPRTFPECPCSWLT